MVRAARRQQKGPQNDLRPQLETTKVERQPVPFIRPCSSDVIDMSPNSRRYNPDLRFHP
jgi:hypothetical protein